MRRTLACLLTVVGFAAFLGAQEAPAGTPPSDTTLSIIAATSLEAKVSVVKDIAFEGDLGKLELKPTANVTPVSVNAGGDVVYTLPLPLLEFSVGGLVGSGWYFAPVKAYGVGVWDEDAEEYEKGVFSNLMYKGKAGAALQFDLAVLLPGDWNHVQFRTYHEINYRALTGVGSEKWIYENTGDNYNQPKYYGSYILAYALPEGMILSRVGGVFTDDLGLEHSVYLLNAGAILGFQFGPAFSIDFAALMKNEDGDGYVFDKAALVFNFEL